MGAVYEKLRESAKGQQCTLLIPNCCQGGTETTVLAHLKSGIGLKGTGMKVPDWWACFACQACHDALDGRRWSPAGLGRLESYILAAVQRTWAIWFEKGLLRVAGDEEKPARQRKGGSSKIVERKLSWQTRR